MGCGASTARAYSNYDEENGEFVHLKNLDQGMALPGPKTTRGTPEKRPSPNAAVKSNREGEDATEIADALRQLEAAAAETGLMHESFRADNPSDFTRAWFAWANGMFGELVLKLARDPQLSHLVLKQSEEEEAQLLGRVPMPRR